MRRKLKFNGKFKNLSKNAVAAFSFKTYRINTDLTVYIETIAVVIIKIVLGAFDINLLLGYVLDIKKNNY